MQTTPKRMPNHAQEDSLHAFRTTVRAFIDAEVPSSMKGRPQGIVQGPGPAASELQALQQALYHRGWKAPHWPPAHGGAGFDLPEMIIFQQELTAAGVPRLLDTGIEMLGPILIRYGSKEQQQRFLGPTLRSEISWAQGYSEPQAGSDLAALALRCRIEAEHFILDGQKVWTSKAHEADWLFVLVRSRSDVARKQDGISFLLVEAASEGIDVRPIHTIDGHHHFNETFFHQVRVPRENLVGELHQGWKIAKGLLGHERFTHPTADPQVMQRALDNVRHLAQEQQNSDGHPLWEDPRLREAIFALQMDVDCLRYARLRALGGLLEGQEPGAETMLFKLFGSELLQRIVDLHFTIQGPSAMHWHEDAAPGSPEETARHVANLRGATLRGGSSEIQRNILAKRVLGLPD